jgi:GNAT superfamily N-acetyltransferase
VSARLPRELREYAEAPDRFALLGPDAERVADERCCLLQGATFASVSDVRVAEEELPGLVDELRARVSGKPITWWLTPSTRPSDAADRLLALGLVRPADSAEHLCSLALAEPPPAVPGVEVRRVETAAEFAQARAVLWDAFGKSDELRERERPQLAGMFEAHRRSGALSHFVALVDGEPAATGSSVHSTRGSFLIGGCVLPAARGRGLYRALVRARWEEAASRGTPAVVTQAVVDTSFPILRRLGFQQVCRLRRLEDYASTGSTPPAR